MREALSKGLPVWISFTDARKASMNVSWMLSCTSTREPAVHIWPWL